MHSKLGQQLNFHVAGSRLMQHIFEVPNGMGANQYSPLLVKTVPVLTNEVRPDRLAILGGLVDV